MVTEDKPKFLIDQKVIVQTSINPTVHKVIKLGRSNDGHRLYLTTYNDLWWPEDWLVSAESN